jgi:CYTH domain-containing protein
MSNSSLEIERVWILDGLPDIPVDAERWRIRQGYLTDPKDDEPFTDDPNIVPHVGRIRSIEDSDGSMRFVHTIKRGTGLVRIEMERYLSEEAFHSAWAETSGRRLAKTRWRVHDGQHTWEVDRFENLKLVLLEVELSHVEESFEIPSWLAGRIVREVTEEPEFRNVAIAARQGLLED